MMNKLLWTQC